MGTINCFITSILQNIVFCVQQEKETHTGWVNDDRNIHLTSVFSLYHAKMLIIWGLKWVRVWNWLHSCIVLTSDLLLSCGYRWSSIQVLCLTLITCSCILNSAARLFISQSQVLVCRRRRLVLSTGQVHSSVLSLVWHWVMDMCMLWESEIWNSAVVGNSLWVCQSSSHLNVLEFFRSDGNVYQAAQMHIWLYYSSVHIAHLEEERLACSDAKWTFRVQKELSWDVWRLQVRC